MSVLFYFALNKCKCRKFIIIYNIIRKIYLHFFHDCYVHLCTKKGNIIYKAHSNNKAKVATLSLHFVL